MTRTSGGEAAELLGLAATPTFVAMALATAVNGGGPMDVLCHVESGWALDGMAVMYGLMSAFHVSPWLRRIGRTQRPGSRDGRSIRGH